MSKPTPDEVQKEIEALRSVKLRLRRVSIFGDDRHSAIDSQIKVLEESLSESAIYETWIGSDSEYLIDNALEARRWLDGKSDTTPSGDWSFLI